MKVIEHPNIDDSWRCPICDTNDNKPCTLISIDGTQNSNIAKAKMFHLDCIELVFNDNMNVLYQFIQNG